MGEHYREPQERLGYVSWLLQGMVVGKTRFKLIWNVVIFWYLTVQPQTIFLLLYKLSALQGHLFLLSHMDLNPLYDL
jgi:hypothetical protein